MNALMKNIQYINWDKTNWTRALNFPDENKTADFKNKKVLELEEEKVLFHYGPLIMVQNNLQISLNLDL